MSKNNLHVLFDDDDILLDAIKKIKEKKHHINEVYTPFPVHGLDKALGLKPTRISILAFIYGCIGFIVSVLMLNYIMIADWPQNIGGKPSFSYLENMPAFVPIMFELTGDRGNTSKLASLVIPFIKLPEFVKDIPLVGNFIFQIFF